MSYVPIKEGFMIY